MNTIQKGPSEFVPTEDRHAMARKQIFSQLMDADMKLVAGIELGLLERLEARLHHKLSNVIESLRKLADKVASA